MNRKKIVAGNWKMNNGIDESVQLAQKIGRHLKNLSIGESIEVIVAPTFISLKSVADELEQSSIKLAAQNIHWEGLGAFTGEVSAPMARDVGCSHVIVGHSERRQYFHETDQTVNKRAISAIRLSSLKPIICVGETIDERESNETTEILKRQLDGALDGITPEEMSLVIIAYEPVWAIGTGKSATPEIAQEAHAFIRSRLSSLYGDSVAEKTRVLYGGSVKPSSARELFARDDIDGGLIGGASLKADDFIAIIESAVEA